MTSCTMTLDQVPHLNEQNESYGGLSRVSDSAVSPLPPPTPLQLPSPITPLGPQYYPFPRTRVMASTPTLYRHGETPVVKQEHESPDDSGIYSFSHHYRQNTGSYHSYNSTAYNMNNVAPPPAHIQGYASMGAIPWQDQSTPYYSQSYLPVQAYNQPMVPCTNTNGGSYSLSIPATTSSPGSMRFSVEEMEKEKKLKRARRGRTSFSRETLEIFERAFKRNNMPSSDERKALALNTQQNEEIVRVWFKNRRAKDKKEMKRLDEARRNRNKNTGNMNNNNVNCVTQEQQRQQAAAVTVQAFDWNRVLESNQGGTMGPIATSSPVPPAVPAVLGLRAHLVDDRQVGNDTMSMSIDDVSSSQQAVPHRTGSAGTDSYYSVASCSSSHSAEHSIGEL